jgi:mannose-6-phosphate isomerase class I
MNKVYKLINQIKHYEWGSAKLIPEFLGVENDPRQAKDKPQAAFQLPTGNWTFFK